MAAALAERRFLAEVEHPNIVKIFNFVEHESSGYIVMEYVGGASLKQILAARREDNGGEADPLPADPGDRVHARDPARARLPASARAAVLRLQDRQRHPDPALAQADRPGRRVPARRSAPRPCSARSATRPRRSQRVGPSVASDLFTVARTLAVLCLDFRGYQSTYRFTLPALEEAPLLARYDSLYRFLLTGTATDPDERFQSAEEMADQLYGVLRELVSDQSGHPAPAPSNSSAVPLRAAHERPDWRVLPRPRSTTTTRGRLPGHDHHRRPPADDRTAERGAQADGRGRAAAHRSADRARGLERGDEALRRDRGVRPVGVARSVVPGSGRAREGRPAEAKASFDGVYHQLPGELAPKLALGMACENDEQLERGGRLVRHRLADRPGVHRADVWARPLPPDAGDRARRAGRL